MIDYRNKKAVDFFKFAAFFPCSMSFELVKYTCKVTLGVCLRVIFHCGAQGYAKVYVRRTLALWQSNEFYKTLIDRVRLPSRPNKSLYCYLTISLVTAGNGRKCCAKALENVFTQLLGRKQLRGFLFCQSNASSALSENRYRVSNTQAKSYSFRLYVRPLKYSAVDFA